MAYKIFILEKELGYPITAKTNGLILMQRLRMLDRYFLDKKKAQEEANNESKSNNNKSNLMK